MTEKDEKSFFEKFGKSRKEKIENFVEIVKSIEKGVSEVSDKSDVEIETPREILKEFSEDKSAIESASLEKKGIDFSTESSSSLETSQINEKLIEKKEYWEKLINSIRTEKLSEDELENKEAQNRKILAKILDILIEKEKEIIQKGEVIRVVKLFREVILPTIKKEDPEINEAYYWDEFRAKIVTVENIPDLS